MKKQMEIKIAGYKIWAGLDKFMICRPGIKLQGKKSLRTQYGTPRNLETWVSSSINWIQLFH